MFRTTAVVASLIVLCAPALGGDVPGDGTQLFDSDLTIDFSLNVGATDAATGLMGEGVFDFSYSGLLRIRQRPDLLLSEWDALIDESLDTTIENPLATTDATPDSDTVFFADTLRISLTSLMLIDRQDQDTGLFTSELVASLHVIAEQEEGFGHDLIVSLGTTGFFDVPPAESTIDDTNPLYEPHPATYNNPLSGTRGLSVFQVLPGSSVTITNNAPAPGALALLGCAGLGVVRRRR